jgi:hypothetical protein
VVEDLGASEDATLVAHQELEQGELFGAQLNRATLAVGATSPKIESQAVYVDLRGLARLYFAPAEGAQTREKLLEGEWLREVVVGAGVEATDAIVDAVERSQEEDRSVEALAAERLAELNAVHPRKKDVEDDDVVRAIAGHSQAVFAVVREVDRVPFFLEHAADDLGEAAFVFDEEEVHGF